MGKPTPNEDLKNKNEQQKGNTLTDSRFDFKHQRFSDSKIYL